MDASRSRNPKAGCTCRPTFYVVVHHDGKLVREKAGQNRRVAERLRDKRSVEVDESAYAPPKKVGFSEWADRWRESLERKQSTKDSYRSTIDYAKRVFGDRLVSRIQPSDIARFNLMLRDGGLSDSTRAKHLRVLGACFASAVEHGVIAQNPVKRLPRSERPRPTKRESAYFTQDELPRLFAEIPAGLHRTLFTLALKTGMRQGELLALTWGDIDLQGAMIHVRKSFTAGDTTTPKNHEKRDVDLTDDLVELLGSWWGECGTPVEPDVLLFPGEGRSGHIAPSTLIRRVLYPAMKRAGVPRVGPNRREPHLPLAPPYLRQTRARIRPPDHLALAPPRPLNAQSHDRHLRPLGTRRTPPRSPANARRFRLLNRRR